MTQLSCTLILVVVIQIYTCVKIHRTVYQKQQIYCMLIKKYKIKTKTLRNREYCGEHPTV